MTFNIYVTKQAKFQHPVHILFGTGNTFQICHFLWHNANT